MSLEKQDIKVLMSNSGLMEKIFWKPCKMIAFGFIHI